MAASARFRPVVASASSAQQHKEALLGALSEAAADAPLPPSAVAAVDQLASIGVNDGEQAGRWRLVSYDALRDRLAELQTPLDLGDSELDVASLLTGNRWDQREVALDLKVGEPSSAVRFRLKGLATFNDLDEQSGVDINVVLLTADLLPPAGGDAADDSIAEALTRCEVALEPAMPPGAMRAALRVVWLDETLCVLRHANDAANVIVLTRLPPPPRGADASDADAALAQVGLLDQDDEEDENDGFEFWVGSPY